MSIGYEIIALIVAKTLKIEMLVLAVTVLQACCEHAGW
jgi:hypothetical protein